MQEVDSVNGIKKLAPAATAGNTITDEIEEEKLRLKVVREVETVGSDRLRK